MTVNTVGGFPLCRERRERVVEQEEDEAHAHDLHRGADPDPAGQLPDRLQPRRPGPRAHRPDHGALQEGDPGLVPELQGQAEEVHQQRKVQESE